MEVPGYPPHNACEKKVSFDYFFDLTAMNSSQLRGGLSEFRYSHILSRNLIGGSVFFRPFIVSYHKSRVVGCFRPSFVQVVGYVGRRSGHLDRNTWYARNQISYHSREWVVVSGQVSSFVEVVGYVGRRPVIRDAGVKKRIKNFTKGV